MTRGGGQEGAPRGTWSHPQPQLHEAGGRSWPLGPFSVAHLAAELGLCSPSWLGNADDCNLRPEVRSVGDGSCCWESAFQPILLS